jgi:hypothetical protein
VSESRSSQAHNSSADGGPSVGVGSAAQGFFRKPLLWMDSHVCAQWFHMPEIFRSFWASGLLPNHAAHRYCIDGASAYRFEQNAAVHDDTADSDC